MPLLLFAVDVPCFSLLPPPPWVLWQHRDAGLASQCKRLSTVQIPWWSHLARPSSCVFWVRTTGIGIRCLFQCNPETCRPVAWAQVCWRLSLFLMKTVQPKIDNLIFDSLGFILRISSAGHFSSRLTAKFVILVAWRITTPHHLGKSWVNDPVACHLHQCPVAPLSQLILLLRLWYGFPSAECLRLSSTSWTALSETPSHCLASASWTSPKRQNFFRLSSASLLALRKTTKTKVCVVVCKQNAEPEPWQWLYSERSHHVWTHSPASLLLGSVTLGTGVCDLGQCALIAYITEFPRFPDAFLTTWAWFKWPNSLPLPWAVKFYAVHLETDRRFEE